MQKLVTLKLWQKQTLQVIGLFAFAAIFVLVTFELDMYSLTHWVPSAKIVRLVVFGTVAFSVSAVQFRKQWRRPRFWILVVGLGALHVLGCIFIVKSVTDVPLPLVSAATIVEIPLICVAIDQFGFSPD